MSTQETSSKSPPPPDTPLAMAEAQLGRVLAIIHRALPRLEELGHAAEVQLALDRAGEFLKAASMAHREALKARGATFGPQPHVEGATVAIIAAAISAVLERPYRMVSVQPVVAPAPHLNVWALEGRTQIFQSHRIR
jgi:hypothetical protein